MSGLEQSSRAMVPTSHRMSRLLMQLVPLVPAADLAVQQRETKGCSKYQNSDEGAIPESNYIYA